MDPIERQIGARLRALRESRGVSCSRLAIMTGASSREIEDYEAGVRAPPVSQIIKLAEALKGSAAQLIDGAREGWSEALTGLAQAGAEGSVELVSAFSSIPDVRTRRAFLEFAWSVAEAEGRATQT
jgi:transcriptional regulator with XRE-family HTH domain